MTSFTGSAIQGREHLEAVINSCGRNLKQLETYSSACFTGIDTDLLLQVELESLSMQNASMETIPFVECFCRTMKCLDLGIRVDSCYDVIECFRLLVQALKAGNSRCVRKLRIFVFLNHVNVHIGGDSVLLTALNEVLCCVPNVRNLKLEFVNYRTKPGINIREVIGKIGVSCPEVTKLRVALESMESGKYWDLFVQPQFLPRLRMINVSFDRYGENMLLGGVELRESRPGLCIW